jgi:hypothetical protein
MTCLKLSAFISITALCMTAAAAGKRELTAQRIAGTWTWTFDDQGEDSSGKPVEGTVESRWVFTESGLVYFTFQFKARDGATTRKALNGRYTINASGNIDVTGDPGLKGEYRIEWIDEKSMMLYNGGSTGPFLKTG